VSKFVFNRKFRAYKSPTLHILTVNHKLKTKEIINPLPSQLEEVYTRYLSVIEEGELDIVQGEWIVKRRNCVATLNNRGSHIRQEVIVDLLFIFITF
jgi:hypothetical protein